MMRRIVLALGIITLITAAAYAQIEVPRVGCLPIEHGALEILGVPGSFLARLVTDAGSCAAVESAWHVVQEVDGAWLERRDADTHAIEDRRKLDAGTWAVFPDGTLVQLDALDLPAPAQSWSLAAADWLLVRTADALLLIRPNGQWFYLPAPEPAGEQGGDTE